MKLFLIFAFFGIGTAAGAQSFADYRREAEKTAKIIALNSDVKEDSYKYNFETENEIKVEGQGHEADGIEAQGKFEYTDDDGLFVYSISYVAGKGGFQPQGDHLPTPAPIPEEILAGLEQNAADEAAGIFDDGSYDPAKYGEASAPAGSRQQRQYARAQASAGLRQQYNKY